MEVASQWPQRIFAPRLRRVMRALLNRSIASELQHTRNVIASLGPETGDRIIVGAHYDTVPGTPGADDNASGVAGLLELSRAISVDIPQTRIDLVA